MPPGPDHLFACARDGGSQHDFGSACVVPALCSQPIEQRLEGLGDAEVRGGL